MHPPTGILAVLILGALRAGVVADDDDDDSGVTSALAAAFIRVKTREIERLLHTSWCVVSGPSCTDGLPRDAMSRSKRSSSAPGSTGHGTNMETAINSFSRCICAASRLGDVCNLNISIYPDSVDHFSIHSSFSVVFHWLGIVKDFYCNINSASTITCDYSQRINVPLPSRMEIQNFAQQIQGELIHKSECGEFCGRFRCIYEAWSDDGRAPFENIYEKCIQHMCSMTAATTVAPALTSRVNNDRTVHAQISRSPVVSPPLPPSMNHTIFIQSETVKPAPRDTAVPDAAQQDGADLESRDSPSSLVGGLIGGLLAMVLLAVMGLTVLMWRKKQRRKQDVPPVSCVLAGQTDTGQSRDYTNLDEHANITATNPLACNGVTTRNADVPDVIHDTAEVKLSADDTYATLNECDMRGPHDNPAYEMELATNKGEELVLGEATPYRDSFYLDGIYAKPSDNSEVPGFHDSASCGQYLEPVSEDDRYVRYPPHYLQPLPELPSADRCIEPCHVRKDRGHPDESYIKMDNTTSVSSTDPSSLDVDQYVRVDQSDPNYYNI